MKTENQKFLTALLHLGLTDKEANVYIALLTLGKATVSVVAREAGINRTTGYDILDALVNYGLVTISGKKPKQEYIAESPANIKKMINSRIRRDSELLEYAAAIIPRLTSIYNIGERPKIRFYEGTDGLKEVYEDTLTSHETIRAYAAVDDMHKALPDYFPKYYQRRARKGIRIRAVIPATKAGKERAAQDKTENRDTALVPAEKFYFSPEINIYDNKIMIASWREKLGIIIESNEIADAMKKIFELSWQEAKHFGQ